MTKMLKKFRNSENDKTELDIRGLQTTRFYVRQAQKKAQLSEIQNFGIYSTLLALL